jgi:catechol 2,3-dioxygenase-like lactoylglutathione lyase family enzyme
VIKVDHIGIAAHDTKTSAYRLADILGLNEPVVDGADGDMYRLDLAHGAFVLFNPAETINLAHVAFRVSRAQFAAIVERMQSLGIPFGNQHDDTQNGQTEDFELGGAGRIYFVDENGHLFEVAC